MIPHEHSLKQNQLLAALPARELKELYQHLELVMLTAGDILCEAGERPNYDYFPVDSALSLYYRMEDGEAAEIAMIGNEGMFSVAGVLGGNSLPYYATVATTGHAFRLNRNVLMQKLDASEALRHTLILYSQAALTQMAQAAVCGRHHSLNQQLCLHLLLVHDKSLADDFILTHDAMAHMLGVRREGVTTVAGKLRTDGLIDYKRGHIKVVDRSGLEAQCCECYQVVKQEFKRLLGY